MSSMCSPAVLFQTPSGGSGSSNPTRNCNFNRQRVWHRERLQDLAFWMRGSSISCQKPMRNGPTSRRYAASRAGRAKKTSSHETEETPAASPNGCVVFWFPRRGNPVFYDRLMLGC
jgi:hypothetical protein